LEKEARTIAEVNAKQKSVEKMFEADADKIFDLQLAMSKRNFIGAPGTKEVAKQLARWREQLS
jgi:argininosuccinate lyase